MKNLFSIEVDDLDLNLKDEFFRKFNWIQSYYFRVLKVWNKQRWSSRDHNF